MSSVLLSVTWDVSPILVDLGFAQIRYYGLFFALGFILGYPIMEYIYKTEGLIQGKNQKELDRLSITMIISTIIGARLGHVLFYEPEAYFKDPITILYIWEGGLASHGAAIAIIIGLFFYTRKPFPKNYLWILDRIVIPIPLGGAFIRIGNLFNSEIYGKPTSLPWGFIYKKDPFAGDIPRHPTQIYEALSYIVLFLILGLLYRKYKQNIKPGLLFGIFLIVLWSMRLIIEFFKEPQVAKEENIINSIGLNIGQLLSLPFILIGLILLFRALFSKKQNPAI